MKILYSSILDHHQQKPQAFENSLLFLSIYTDYILMLFLKNYSN